MLTFFGLVAAGVVILSFSGDKLVTFASALAERARLTPAVIGLTVVAAGTSFPELFVSTTAALGGSPDIAMGNVVGSNISNVALILGICALVAPIPVSLRLLKLEYPFMLLSSFIALLLARDGLIDRLECAFFIASMVGFTAYSVIVARETVSAEVRTDLAEQIPSEAPALSRRPLWQLVGALLLSFLGLSGGARLLVEGAIGIATAAGMSERLVGLTVVAVGTSLPELVATLAAAAKKQHEMAVTNIVGSNVFNTLLILGTTGLLKPVPVARSIIAVDMWVMMAVGALLFFIALATRKVGRVSGGVLLGTYAAYTAFLVMSD